MGVIEALKKRNRTLLEMQIGMVFFGLICQLVGSLIVKEQRAYAVSLWFGIAFAFAASIHMCRTLDRALWYGKDASAIVVRGYFFRYAIVAGVAILLSLTEVLNPLVFFLGYMSLKVTAYLQPITHKLCNKVFHETDPVPEPLQEEPVSQGEEIPAKFKDFQK